MAAGEDEMNEPSTMTSQQDGGGAGTTTLTTGQQSGTLNTNPSQQLSTDKDQKSVTLNLAAATSQELSTVDAAGGEVDVEVLLGLDPESCKDYLAQLSPRQILNVMKQVDLL